MGKREFQLLDQWPVFILAVIGLFLGCGSSPTYEYQGTRTPSHTLYDSLLKAHVDSLGNVDYQGFINDSAAFDRYLTFLSDSAPSKEQSDAEKIAYWINAYNAFTIKLIVDNYPLESITDLHPTLYVPAVNTVWHKKFFEIDGNAMSLDQIEHEILRKQFNEPRMHFAIVCASKSCPKLLNTAYTADSLEYQLSAQTVHFLADTTRNKIGADEVKLSKIFSWFKGDFTKTGSLIDFLNVYSPTPINPDAKIKHLEYDWALNERPKD